MNRSEYEKLPNLWDLPMMTQEDYMRHEQEKSLAMQQGLANPIPPQPRELKPQSTEDRQITLRELHDRCMEQDREIKRLSQMLHDTTKKRWGSGPAAVAIRLAVIESHIKEDDTRIRAYKRIADDAKKRAEQSEKVAAHYQAAATSIGEKLDEFDHEYQRLCEAIGPIGDDMRSLAEILAAVQASTLQLGTDNQAAHGRVLKGVADCIDLCDKVRRGVGTLQHSKASDSSDDSVQSESAGEQQPLPSGCDVE